MRNEDWKLDTVIGKDHKRSMLTCTLEEKLGIQSYMTSAYVAWEKGSNERNNREIRVHIPKGSDIGQWNDEGLETIQDRINHMPREIHGGKIAYEVHYGVETKLLRYALQVENNFTCKILQKQYF